MTKFEAAAKAERTDKYSHGYMPVYEQLLQDLQCKAILEMGVRGGKSLRMWRRLFPKADIHGIDMDPHCLMHSGENISVHVGGQTDRGLLTALSSAFGPWDFIVDDASHLNELIVESFDILHTRVRPGGWYFIEDLQCRNRIRERERVIPNNAVNADIPEESLTNDPKVIDEFMLELERMEGEGLVSEIRFELDKLLCIQFADRGV